VVDLANTILGKPRSGARARNRRSHPGSSTTSMWEPVVIRTGSRTQPADGGRCGMGAAVALSNTPLNRTKPRKSGRHQEAQRGSGPGCMIRQQLRLCRLTATRSPDILVGEGRGSCRWHRFSANTVHSGSWRWHRSRLRTPCRLADLGKLESRVRGRRAREPRSTIAVRQPGALDRWAGEHADEADEAGRVQLGTKRLTSGPGAGVSSSINCGFAAYRRTVGQS